MKSLCTSLLVMLVLAVAVVEIRSQIPIPRRKVGFVYKEGAANASIHLDFYIDLVCPDSKRAFPFIKQVADFYGPEVLQLTTHLFPLPYHRNGFYAAKGAHAVTMATNGTSTYDWFQTMYDNIESLTNTATHDMSDEQVLNLLGKLAADLGVSPSDFVDMVGSAMVEQDTRIRWKYCCTRGVAQTPTFMLNDITVFEAQPSWTLADWRKVIDPLLAPQANQNNVGISHATNGQSMQGSPVTSARPDLTVV